jgi:hypothetical protein
LKLQWIQSSQQELADIQLNLLLMRIFLDHMAGLQLRLRWELNIPLAQHHKTLSLHWQRRSLVGMEALHYRLPQEQSNQLVLVHTQLSLQWQRMSLERMAGR